MTGNQTPPSAHPVNILNHELTKLFHTPWLYLAIGIGSTLAVSAGIESYLYLQRENAQLLSLGYGLGLSAHNVLGQTREGSFGNWMLVGANAPLAASIFFYALPLLVLIPFAWSYRTEARTGYAAHIAVRDKRSSYVASKMLASFVSGAVVTAVPLLINFLVVSCLFPAYLPLAEDSSYVGVFVGCFFSELFYNQPLLFVAAYTVFDALLMGLWAAVVLALSSLIHDRVTLMVIPYLLFLAWSYAIVWVFQLLDVNSIGGDLLAALSTLSLGTYNPVTTAIEVLILVAVAILLSRRLASEEMV